MARTQQVECDLCEEIFLKDDHPGGISPYEIKIEELLHRNDPLQYGPIFEAGEYQPLMSGDQVNFDICGDCLGEVLDFNLIKEKYEN